MNNKMKCILHIGTEKTGTTSIQDFLVENHKALKELGYGTLRTLGRGNNRQLAAYSMKENRLNDDYFQANNIFTEEQKKQHDADAERKFGQELNGLSEDDCHTVIISSEHFHSRVVHQEEIIKLKLLLEDFFSDIQVVVYLRPQVDVATSLYSTAVRAGETRDFTEFVHSHCTPTNYYYNYADLLKKWGEAFGCSSLVVKIFEKDSLFEGSVVQDFLHVCGILDQSSLVFPSKVNESLTTVGQELLRLSNDAKKKAGLNSLTPFPGLPEFVEENLTGKGCSLGNEEAKKLQEQFAKINESVAKDWFSRDVLFDASITQIEKRNLDPLVKKAFSFLFNITDSFAAAEKDGAFNRYINSIQSADLARDIALLYEKNGDIDAAYKFMCRAAFIRPEGPVISKKLSDYKVLLYVAGD